MTEEQMRKRLEAVVDCQVAQFEDEYDMYRTQTKDPRGVLKNLVAVHLAEMSLRTTEIIMEILGEQEKGKIVV